MTWVVLLLDGSPAPGVHAVFVIPEGETVANEFAEYLTREVDPAVAMRASSPTSELLASWRASVAEVAR